MSGGPGCTTDGTSLRAGIRPYISFDPCQDSILAAPEAGPPSTTVVAAPLVVRTWHRTAAQPSGRLAGVRSHGVTPLDAARAQLQRQDRPQRLAQVAAEQLPSLESMSDMSRRSRKTANLLSALSLSAWPALYLLLTRQPDCVLQASGPPI